MASKAHVLASILSSLILLAGVVYLYHLQVDFPYLVFGHGAGERFYLNPANNYTFQIPWDAYSRLHLTLEANATVELYMNGEYTCNCSHHDLVIESGEHVSILLKSNSPVSGRFIAWQEIPLEEQMLALGLIILGVMGIVLSIATNRKSQILS